MTPTRLVPSPAAARRSLKRGYFRALAWARVERLMREIHTRRGQPLVVNLHRISPEPNPYWSPLTPEAFAALAAFLASRCHCTTFAELPVAPVPHRPVVILSFDDGCRDFIEYAMPILHRHRVRANHNVIGASVQTGRPPWTIALCDALNAASRRRVEALRVPGFPLRSPGDDEVSQARFGTTLCNFLKAMPPTQRAGVWPALQSLLEETPPHRFTVMMSAADVGEVCAAHELGAHSYSHESMEHLDDRQFTADFDRCQAVLASFGRPVQIYAFPNDSHRAGQLAILRARGVKHLLLGPGPKTDVPGVHRRLPLYGDSPAELRLRALAAPLPTGF